MTSLAIAAAVTWHLTNRGWDVAPSERAADDGDELGLVAKRGSEHHVIEIGTTSSTEPSDVVAAMNGLVGRLVRRMRPNSIDVTYIAAIDESILLAALRIPREAREHLNLELWLIDAVGSRVTRQ